MAALRRPDMLPPWDGPEEDVMRVFPTTFATSAGIVVLMASALPGVSESPGVSSTVGAGISQAPARPSEPAPAHGGHALCIHYDVLPVTFFVDDYYDPMGNHYHGWLPPAGPPFYVQCEWATAPGWPASAGVPGSP